MGDAYPELRTQPRDDREDDPRRGEPVRSGADRRAAAPRSGDRQGARDDSRRCCRATRRSSSTTRSACPTTSSRTRRRRRASRVDRGGVRARRWRASATRRARGSAFGGGKKGEEFAIARTTARARRRRRSVRGLRDDARDRRAGPRAVRRAAAAGRRRCATGQSGYVALARTPFYLEAGGQVSDTGRIVNEATGASATVEGLVAHPHRACRARTACASTRGALRVRDIVTAEVDADVRDATRRNHTATHLLHAALRAGARHARQAGRLARRARSAAVRLRALSAGHARRARSHRADRQRADRAATRRCTTEVRSTQEAIAAGAMALFGEKYGDQVRVVSVPGFSLELCGGTHVQRDRRHRLLRRSSRRAASRRACGASRR